MKTISPKEPPTASSRENAAAPPHYIRKFSEITINDIPLVGGKTASLGEMFRELSSKGVQVPDGFAITAPAYRDFLQAAGLDRKINDLLRGLDTRNLEALRNCGAAIREAILSASFPPNLEEEITSAYERLRDAGARAGVAVRSSATAEDLPDASFAGQQETYLNVRGGRGLIDACRRCFASLFTDRAISYRADKGFDQSKIALSVAVQRMVRSDLSASGVMFTIDTETGFSRRRFDQRRLWAGRERGPGLGQSRRVLRFQTDLDGRVSADSAEEDRQ